MPTPPDALLQPTERLSDRLAERLRGHIDSGEWPPGHRLPTEQKLTEQFGVSRTVVREAVSRLKSMGLLTSRQGAGMFVSPRHQARALAFDPTVLNSLEAVLHMVEVRRTLEGEVAGLAAERIDKAGAKAIQQALVELDAAVARGEDGVEQDLLFHRTIAKATRNPHFERLLDFLEQYQREAIKVTRANESMKAEFMRQVKAEHAAIAQAIAKGQPDKARKAATRHMLNAARRIELADAPVRQALDAALAGSAKTRPATSAPSGSAKTRPATSAPAGSAKTRPAPLTRKTKTS
jgi:GntR family transcriptional regulator, transcriptional repressor for pyruvate dehydrogenase complex